jgi:phosphoglycolate phosphatase
MPRRDNFALIFDFDGTICDTFTPNTIKAFYSILPAKVKRKYSLESLDGLRNKSLSEMVEDSGVTQLEMILIGFRFRRLFSTLMKDFRIVSGMKESLARLHSSGARMFIVTTNKKSNIINFIKFNNIEYFEFISSEFSLGKKHTKILKIINQFKLDKEKTYYIGDEVRDIIAARESGINAVSVTWGLNNKEVLQENNPNYLVDNPVELLEIFKL